MANRITIQDGYEMPFDAFGRARRKRRKSRRKAMSGAMKKQQSKMKACAVKWRRSGTGKYQNFMSKCLKGR